MPLNLIWLEQATHPLVPEAGDAEAEPALRSFDLAGSRLRICQRGVVGG